MKTLFIICFIFLFGWFGTSPEKATVIRVENQMKLSKDTVDFRSQVRPILEKNCSPCHFTGGKMYERMPFDKDTTIINHQTGILKRIKGGDNALIRSFIEQQAKQ